MGWAFDVMIDGCLVRWDGKFRDWGDWEDGKVGNRFFLDYNIGSCNALRFLYFSS